MVDRLRKQHKNVAALGALDTTQLVERSQSQQQGSNSAGGNGAGGSTISVSTTWGQEAMTAMLRVSERLREQVSRV